MNPAETKRVRIGFGAGAALVVLLGWMAWDGWTSGGRNLGSTDVIIGGVLLCVWIGWEIYSRSTNSARP